MVGVGRFQQPFWTRPPVVLCSFVAVLAYLGITLEAKSLWLDEISSLHMSAPELSWTELFGERLHDKHPPLYFLLLHLWQKCVGSGDGAVRALSLIPFVLCGVLFTEGFARRLLDRRLSALPLLFLTSAGVLIYAQEVRPYMFALWAALAGLLLSLHAVTATATGRPLGRGFWVGLVATVWLGSLVHYFAFLNLGIVLVLLAVLFFRSQQRTQAWWCVVIGAVPLIINLAWLTFTRDGWSALPGLRDTSELARTARRFGAVAVSYNAPLVALALWAMAKSYGPMRADRKIWLVATSVVLTLLGAMLISLVEPILSPRNLIVLLPGMFYVMADGLRRWSHTGRRRIAVGMSLALSAGLAVLLQRMPVEQWRESARFVDAIAACREGTVLAYPTWRPYVYHRRYLRSRGLEFRNYDQGLVETMSSQSCPVLLWAGHLSDAEFDSLLAGTALGSQPYSVRRFKRVFVVLRASPGS